MVLNSPGARFIAEVNAFIKGTKKEIKLQAKAVMLETFSRVVLRTPVLTGRLRGSWQISINSEPGENQGEDKQGGVVLSFVRGKLDSFDLGDMVYFYNYQPYARRIEYGYSKKAPRGMVRVTLGEMNAIVSEVTR